MFRDDNKLNLNQWRERERYAKQQFLNFKTFVNDEKSVNTEQDLEDILLIDKGGNEKRNIQTG